MNWLTYNPHYKKRFISENTEKAGHNVKMLPGKMCTLTSVVQSQHAIGQTRKKICIPRTSAVLVNTIRHSGLVGVLIQRTGFVFYRTLVLYAFIYRSLLIQISNIYTEM